MFQNLLQYPIESPLLHWESKVVIRDVDNEPQLYVRLKLTGTTFPIYDTIPFVRVGEVKGRFVQIADNGLTVNAYFASAVPNEGAIEFGYDDKVLLRFPRKFQSRDVIKLDNARLPRKLQYQERLFEHQIE
jgi:hypothetical protein